MSEDDEFGRKKIVINTVTVKINIILSARFWITSICLVCSLVRLVCHAGQTYSKNRTYYRSVKMQHTGWYLPGRTEDMSWSLNFEVWHYFVLMRYGHSISSPLNDFTYKYHPGSISSVVSDERSNIFRKWRRPDALAQISSSWSCHLRLHWITLLKVTRKNIHAHSDYHQHIKHH